MNVAAGFGRRNGILALGVLSLGLLAFTVAVITDRSLTLVAFALVTATLLIVGHRTFLAWRTLVVALFLVILFVPVGRAGLPGAVPFRLEPYRLLLFTIVVAWIGSLLVDHRVRIRASGLEAPIVAVMLSALASIIANGDRIARDHIQVDVVRALTFFLGFLLLFYLLVGLVRTLADLDALIRILVVGGSVIGILAVIEARFAFNPFDHLADAVPLLTSNFEVGITERYGEIRAYGPAEHPIALGAALVMLIPLAVYLAHRTAQKRWWLAAIALTGGALATGSRTGVIMLGVLVLVYLVFRPRQTLRFWPVLIPVIVVMHFTLPGVLGTVYGSFFPSGGLVESERVSEGSRSSAGRIADLKPSLDEYSRQPVFGQGLGSRITSGPGTNATLLDDQWLSTLLETGLCGAVAWGWLYFRFLRRAGRGARADLGSRGLLLTGIFGSVTAFGVAMFLFDSFSFTQVTLLFFILLAFGCIALSLPESEPAVEGAFRSKSSLRTAA